MIQRLVREVARFWFAEGSATRLALLRIIIGTYALYWVTDHYDVYMRNAVTNPSLFEPVGPVAVLSSPLPPGVFQAVLTVTIIANVLFVLGAGHRVTGPAFGVLLLWVLSYRNSWGMIFHTDNLLALHVLILGFTRSADAIAVDALQRAPSAGLSTGILRRWTLRTPHPSWEYGYAVRLLCLIITLTYFLSGVAKLSGPLGASWAVGESLRTQVAWDVWRKELLVANPPQLIFAIYDQLWLFSLLAIGTLLIELGAPLVMLSGWLAALWIPATLSMHWGIELIMGIEFPYQLYGVAFAPFIPFDRVLAWIGRGLHSFMARFRGRDATRVTAAGGLGVLIGGMAMLMTSFHLSSTASAENLAVDKAAIPASQIVWVGDILIGDAAQHLVESKGFEWPFRYVSEMLAGAFVVGNAEGPITTRQAPYFPDARWSYNASPESADALAHVGIDALSLANNHTFDRGPDGLIDTIEQLQRVGIQSFGAGLSIEDASRPLLIPTPHGAVAVVGFAQGGATRPPAGHGQFGILQIDSSALPEYRARALEAGARWVVAFVHWGANYTPIRPIQRRAAEAFAEAGYDLVIGHHPHVVQPVERIGDMPVVYSLGNFVFGSTGRFTPDFPGYGLVAKSIIDEDGMRLELSCIVTDNGIVAFQPRPCTNLEAQGVIEGLGPEVTLSGGRGVLKVK